MLIIHCLPLLGQTENSALGLSAICGTADELLSCCLGQKGTEIRLNCATLDLAPDGSGKFRHPDLIQKMGPNKENLMSPRHSQARGKSASVFSLEAVPERSHG